MNELNQYIEDLFSDEKSGVWLSTVHRAKGLESNRVVILQYNRLPLYWKEQHEFEAVQEENLLYVALTRARQELVLVSKERDGKVQPGGNHGHG
ncbi:MAG: ATP-binding domain-containing protein [Anaerolinea sp.]|nr:ATP-binding domain-containing protein [Anaerolinea sp.]